jgi:hypothetical protein
MHVLPRLSGKRAQVETFRSSISRTRERAFASPGKVNNMPLLQAVEILVVMAVLLWPVREHEWQYAISFNNRSKQAGNCLKEIL